MTSSLRAVGLSLFAVLVGCSAPEPGSPPADRVFRDGMIWTGQATQTSAEALAIRGNEIIYVGPDGPDLEALIGPATEVTTIGDGMVLPGFIDGHIHPLGIGLAQTIHCDVSGLGKPQAIIDRLADCASDVAEGGWLVGRGWALGAFEQSNPTAAMLDAVLPEGMAAYVTAEDGHNAWVNSEALSRAGVDAGTLDPAGGIIERDETGAPTGTLRETAMGLVARLLPPITPAQRRDGLVAAMQRLNSFGLTGLTDAGADFDDIALYDDVAAAGDATLRSTLALWVGPDTEVSPAAFQAALRPGDPMVQVSQIKMMLDGVLETQTAHLTFLYPGLGHYGKQFFEDEGLLVSRVTQLEGMGYQIHFHTVGDAAIKQGLRALEASRESRNATNRRPIFAHDYIVEPEDYQRLQDANAHMQLTMLWDQQNDSMVNLNKPFLTDQQYADLMPADALAAAGLPLVGGSDAPVGQADPLASIQVAVTGQAVPYFKDGDFDPDQPAMPGGRTELEVMLRAYTIDAAQAAGRDDITGSLAVGKRADIVVLERNLFTIDPSTIYGTPVRETLLDGRTVYQAGSKNSK